MAIIKKSNKKSRLISHYHISHHATEWIKEFYLFYEEFGYIFRSKGPMTFLTQDLKDSYLTSGSITDSDSGKITRHTPNRNITTNVH